jgi:hypothetical protein
MATLINVISSVNDFLSEINELIKKQGLFLYIEKKDANHKRSFITINPNEITDFGSLIDDEYFAFFIASKPFDKKVNKNFYDDSIFEYCIEGLGGRTTIHEVENISLRLIAKKPDSKIKSLFAAIQSNLKKNEDYGMGAEPSMSAFYKNIFYKKKIVNEKTLWMDFKRKIHPIVLTMPSNEG